jgi:hypothetical protein
MDVIVDNHFIKTLEDNAFHVITLNILIIQQKFVNNAKRIFFMI